MDRLLTADEVSQVLGISKDLVRRYAREDYVPHTKIGGAVRFERAKPLRTERKREKDQKEGHKGFILNKQNNQKEITRIPFSDSQDLVISVVDDEKLDIRIWVKTKTYTGPTKRGV